MKNDSKIQLSPMEMDLVNNRDIILTKNVILVKAMELLGSLQVKINDYLAADASSFPAEVSAIPPKISKGENYLGLPYRILDHPRYFMKDDVMAVRTLFWWGNFFSMTLHLSGKYKKSYAPAIEKNYTHWKKQGFFICVNEDPWEHHFEKDNYVQVSQLDKLEFEKKVSHSPFLKLAVSLPIDKWNEAPESLYNQFKQLMEGIRDQLPRR
ncbi:MAG TPA: hypothetical protein VLJ68_11825 [Chitinophagaceae bacterium]|nr:hypothetical protein [Chitinophagaceae bacterium]